MVNPNKNIAEEFLNACDYISQDKDTVYINTEAIVTAMEAYGDYIVDKYIEEEKYGKQ